MVKHTKTQRGRWLLLIVLSLASIVFTGCEKGSLGVKGGTAIGYIINSDDNKPISDVLVRASQGEGGKSMTTYTAGDGKYSFHDLSEGSWNFNVEKYGYALIGGGSDGNSSDTTNLVATTVAIKNGQTVTNPIIKMAKTESLYKGTLKGYPIDAVTGRPLRNFTVNQMTPYSQRKSKLFETAEDFRDSGWSGLKGGNHHYTISCQNYQEYSTAGEDGSGPEISIGPSAVDLGVIKLEPHKVSVSGALRNLPGYILGADSKDILIWAESAGKMVASSSPDTALQGSVVYTISEIPVTVGAVSIKCKVRGYDVHTINTSVSLPNNIPGGTIAGIDADFHNIDPIRRDLRVVVTGTKPEDGTPSSFSPGEIARVYIKQGGKDIVPYVDVVSVNYKAEAYITGVITGYPIEIIVINQNNGFYKVTSEPFTVEEDGNTTYTTEVQLEG